MAISATDGGARVVSPCVRKCTLGRDDVCVGCFRSIDEICAWSGADDERRREILQLAAARRKGKHRRA